MVKENNQEKKIEKEVSFDTLLEKVRHKVEKEVSVALCFIFVLHLCSEKGFSLQQSGIEDLLICNMW